MSDTLMTFLLTWLFWWLLFYGAYAALLFACDAMLVAFLRHQEVGRNLSQKLVRIERQAYASVDRIGAAYAVAQQLMGEDAAASRECRR